MSLKDKIKISLSESMKAKDKVKTNTLRLILAAIKDKEISIKEKTTDNIINDNDIQDILSKMRQQRLESLKMYEQAGRIDLANVEQSELDIIAQFMPPPMNENEIEEICKKLITELNIRGLKDIGKLMGKLKQSYGHSIDLKFAGSIIKKLLQ